MLAFRLEREHIRVTLAVESSDLALQGVGPEDAFVLRLRAWEFHDHFTRLEVCYYGALVASRRHDKIVIGHAP